MNDDRDPIDASLRRTFAVPDLSALQARIEAMAADPSARAMTAPRRRVAVLAALAAAAVVVVLARGRATPDDGRDPVAIAELDARRAAGTELLRLRRAGATLPQPDDLGPTASASACDDDAGPTLADPGDLVLLGRCGGATESCGGALPPGARVLHLRRGSDDVDLAIYIVARHDDPHPLVPDDADARIFRTELGAFVIYEVTPLAEPIALDRFAL